MSLLLEQIEHLLTTLEAVNALEAQILGWGVQGELVPQNPDDVPVNNFLPNYPPTEDEKLFDLPSGWIFTKLDKICDFENGDRGKNYPSKDVRTKTGIPFINAGHLSKNGIDFTNMNYISRERFNLLRMGKIKKGDILFCLRGSLGKVSHVRNVPEGAIASSLVIIHPGEFILEDFLLIYFRSPHAERMLEKYRSGAAQPNLSMKNLKKYEIPLSPLAEQKRIVAKVESLLAQTAAIKERLIHAEKEQRKLNQSALAHLTGAETPAEFAERWGFIKDNFDLLYSHPENVAELKQSILQLAVQGKLVKQNSDDEPASELLKKIKAEKAQLLKEGKIRKSKPLPKISEDEIPYNLLPGWEWVRVDTISDIGTGSTPLRSNLDYWEDGTIPWITSSATNEPFVEKASELITEKAYAENNLRIYPPGTLVIALYGQGKTRGQISELLIEASTNQACAAIVLDGIAKECKDFIKLFFQKSYDDIRTLAEGGAQPNLNVGKIKNTIIAFPPLEEQKRIIEKTHRLLKICDELEAGLVSARESHARVVRSVLGEVG